MGNGNEGDFTFLNVPELLPHHQMQFSVRSRTHWVRGFYHLCSWCILQFHQTVLWKFILHRLIGLMGRVFANGPGDLGSIPGRVIPKILKMVLDTSLLNTQQYKVRIKGKVEQSNRCSSF